MRGSRTSGHALLAAIFLATSATAQHTHNIFARQSTCPDPSLSRCAQAGLPANFCCGSGSTCIPLAGNSTLLCCPTGADCTTIKPITCDITAQDITLHSSNMLKTTIFTVPLATCNGQCCPFGYSCNSGGNCVQNADQNAKPGVSAISPTSTSASPTSSKIPGSASLPSTSPTSPSINTALVVAQNQCNNFPAPAILAGFFPGLAVGIMLSVATVCILGSRRRRSARKSGSSFGNISEPVGGCDMRSDFTYKYPQAPSRAGESRPGRRSTVYRVKSMFRKYNDQAFSLAPPLPLNVQRPMVQQRKNRPVTPPLQREVSSESISIYADTETASSFRDMERTDIGSPQPPQVSCVKDKHQTTFSDLIERSALAGLPKGQPYVYRSPGYTQPR